MRRLPIFGTQEKLPRRLGSLNFAGVEVFTDQRLGVGIRYAHQFNGTKADCSLSNLGLADLSSNLHSVEVVELFRQACRDVLTAARCGWYLDLELRPSEYLRLIEDEPEAQFLFASFSYRQADGPDTHFAGPRVSHLALRIDQGLINRVRYTYLQGADDEQSYQGCLHFLCDWLQAVQHASLAEKG